MNATQTALLNSTNPTLEWLNLVREQVGSLDYGTVEIIVQDRKVIEIVRKVRLRFAKPLLSNEAGKPAARPGQP